MTTSHPLVSFCLIVRNEARFIAETLDSIARQTLADFEVQIFDNASDDATPEICARYLRDPRFQYFRNAANIGLVANLNRCHAAARGKYVALLSGNDLLAETYLEKLVGMAEADPSIGLVAARLRVIQESSEVLPASKWVAPVYFETDPEDRVAAGTTVVRHWRYGNYIFGVFRRSVLDRLQPLRYFYGADAAFIFELSLYARIRVYPEELFLLRQHGGPQVEQVQRGFSEDTVFNVPPNGPFTHFDLVAPYVDLTWSFLEVTTYARIPEPDKARLFTSVLAVQRAKWGRRIDQELTALKVKAPETLRILRTRRDSAAHRALVYRLLIRLGRAAVVAPGLRPCGRSPSMSRGAKASGSSAKAGRASRPSCGRCPG